MRTEIVRIVPALARQWVEQNNKINRPIRRTVVAHMKLAFQRGEFKTTHQGIAFDLNGDLADGQHRLAAIAEMPDDFAVEMMVTWEMPPEAFEAIDQGLRRTASDIMNIPPGLAAVARTLVAIRDTARVGGYTPPVLRPFVAGIEREYYRLVEFCPATHKTFSSARVRAAACLHMVAGNDADYVEMSYYALNHQEYDTMRPIVQTFNKQVQGVGNTRADVTGMNLFCRAFKAFDVRHQTMEALQISDATNVLQRARELIDQHVLKTTPIAPLNRVSQKKRPKTRIR